MKEALKRNKYLLVSLASALILLGVWELVARCIDLAIALPTFSSVFLALINLFTKSKFYVSIAFTLLRSLIGFIIGFSFGVILGIVAGRYKAFNAAMRPIVSTFRSIPVVAITLVLALWVGSEILPAVIGVMLIFPIIYEQIKTATENIDPTLNDVLAELGSGFFTSAKNVYLPLVTPYALSSISTTFGMNIKAVVSAEVLAYTLNSIGREIYFANANFLEETPTLFAWVLITLILSVILEVVLRIIMRKVVSKLTWFALKK
ncbi:MAG: ABC transporter permease subunit [Clostridia bacterium]|nr:ABC transporter permease subunit [Clostridia bacterium]